MLNIFKINPEERPVAMVALVFTVLLNALVVAHYFPQLSALGVNYHDMARDVFHMSGFDAWSYSVVSHWSGWQYNVIRHPLLAIFMLIPCLVNQLLIWLTGVNCAVPVVAAVEVFFGFYGAIFFFRIMRQVVCISRTDTWIVAAFFYSMAYIMLTLMVPDHFNLTLCMMMAVLYVAGRQMQSGNIIKVWQTVVMFFLMAGVSLNNGVKVFLAALFVNGRRLFRVRYMLLGIIVPSALMWGVANLEHQVWEAPRQAAAAAKLKAQDKAFRDSLYQSYADTASTHNPKVIQAEVNKIIRQLAIEKYRRNHANPKIGDPMSKTGFMAWTDRSTSRWDSVVENLFGESIQLHRNVLLQDILKDNRPMIVAYEHWHYYCIEGLVALLFAAGIWAARRSRFFWMAFSWFAFDMLIHVVLGFGINEVYIMTAQWAFILPLAMAYLLKSSKGLCGKAVRAVVALLALYLFVYNGSLIIGYLC